MAASVSMKIPIKQVHPNPLQPRGKKPRVTDLTKSMDQIGLVQPIVVAKDGNGYVVIAGHRRWMAAVLLKWTEIDCVVVPVSDPKLDIGRIMAENETRSDLNGKERAAGYQTMIDMGWDDKAIQAISGADNMEISAARTVAATKKKETLNSLSDQASLLELAGLIEFEDDPVTLETLNAAVGTNNFLHRLERARQEKVRTDRIEGSRATLEKEGTRIVDREKSYYNVVKLTDRRMTEVTDHEKCPGHCAMIHHDGTVDYCCDKPGEHGITLSSSKSQPRDLALERRKRQMRVLWRASATVRQDFVRTQLPPKTAVKSTDFMNWAWNWAQTLGIPAFSERVGNHYTKSVRVDTRFLAICVSEAERAIDGWVKFSGAIGDPGYHGLVNVYLIVLGSLGYPISDHEKAVIEGKEYVIPEPTGTSKIKPVKE